MQKKTVLLITGEDADIAACVKLRLADRGVLSVIVQEEEFLGAAWNLYKDRLLTEGGKARFARRVQNYQEKRREKEGVRAAIPAHLTARATRGITHALERYRPALVVLFSPNLLLAAADARDKVAPDLPLVAAHADYVLDHRYAIRGRALTFVAQNMGVKTNLVNAGIAEEQVVTGAFPTSCLPRRGEKPSFFRRNRGSDAPDKVLVEARSDPSFFALLPALEGVKQAGKLRMYCAEQQKLLQKLQQDGYDVCNEGVGRAGALGDAALYLTYPHADLIRSAAGAAIPTLLVGAKKGFETRTRAYFAGTLLCPEGAEQLQRALDDWQKGARPAPPDNGDNGAAFYALLEGMLHF